MKIAKLLRRSARVTVPVLLCAAAGSAYVAFDGPSARLLAPEAHANQAPAEASAATRIVGMRRLTESQYRNAIADIFGPDVVPVGRFEPIVRTSHQLIAAGASSASISPTGMEQFDTMARGVAAQAFNAQHRDTFVTCKPTSDRAADDACARQTLGAIGRYLFRRPLNAVELAAFTSMANAAATRTASFTDGLELALAAMLVSPQFLYVVETAEPDPGHPGQWRLDNWSRAARLSFLLWNTTPDRTLLDAAAAGKLTDPAALDAQARRMTASPRLEAGVRAFFADMLIFEKFDELAKDPVIYPRFNPDVLKALPEQMQRTIVDHLVTRRGDYRDLFTTTNTFLTRSLGPVYMKRVQNRNGWEPYTFPAGDDRAGLFGQAGFLALYSHSGRSSPTLRGRAVRELLLCQPVPNPPGNVNFTVVQDTNNPVLRTARERLDAHATDPSCSGCHRITDPIGLTLEGFDGIGATRTSENGQAIDLGGVIDGKPFKGALGLGKTIASDPSLTDCAAQRVFEYTVGRPADNDGKAVAALSEAFAKSGYRFPDLMYRVATMPEAWRIVDAPLGAPAHVVAVTPTSPRNGATR